jgi:hypothetical protein
MKNQKIITLTALVTITFLIPLKISGAERIEDLYAQSAQHNLQQFNYDDYIQYNETSHVLQTISPINSAAVINKIKYLVYTKKPIKSIILDSNGMIDDEILDFLKDNVPTLNFLNITNAIKLTGEAIRNFHIARPLVKLQPPIE